MEVHSDLAGMYSKHCHIVAHYTINYTIVVLCYAMPALRYNIFEFYT